MPRFKPCVRSGFCCNKVPCPVGLHFGADAQGPCRFLEGKGPGRYACGMVRKHPEFKEVLSIGEGCPNTLFNTDRDAALAAIAVTDHP